MDKRVGRMEQEESLLYVMNKFKEHDVNGKKLKVELIRSSKNHGGKPMLHIYEEEPDGISCYHLEISESGIFSYTFDDSIS